MDEAGDFSVGADALVRARGAQVARGTVSGLIELQVGHAADCTLCAQPGRGRAGYIILSALHRRFSLALLFLTPRV